MVASIALLLAKLPVTAAELPVTAAELPVSALLDLWPPLRTKTDVCAGI
jgi:hypothetical protein